MNSGVYFIKCIKNGYVYIGCSVNIKNRILVHFNNLKKNKHSNKSLQKDFNIFGIDNFIFRVIENCCVEKLLTREEYWESKITKTYSIRKEHKISATNWKIEQFKSLIIKLDNGCWTLNRDTRENGYHYFPNCGYFVLGHRFSYWLFKDNDISGYHICHKCDNKYCVNPDHLFKGSVKDNQVDRAKKGTGYIFNEKIVKKIRKIYLDYQKIEYVYEFLSMIGFNFELSKSEIVNNALQNKTFYDPNYIPIERHKKMNKEIVSYIKKDYINGIKIFELVNKYKFKYHTISKVINNKNWKHVEPAI